MIATNLFQNPNLSTFHFPIPQCRILHRSHHHNLPPKSRFPSRKSLRNPNFGRFKLLQSKPNPNFQVCVENGCHGGLGIDVDSFSETGNIVLPVELCMTQTLPPALTLRHAVDKMKEAVEKLGLDPPCSESGVLRFQVAVPPSTKAMNWFCCQQKSSRVFPLFYLLEKHTYEQSCELASENGVQGVSGIGTALYFHGSSHKGYNLMARYLSIESPIIRAYGFIDVSYNRTTDVMEQQPGSFYFCIPQVELNEYEGCSFMASTLIWDNTLDYTFGDAVHSFKKSLHQIINSIRPTTMHYQDMQMNYNCGESNLNINEVQMVYLNAETLAKFDAGDKCMQPEQLPTSYESYFWHSVTVCFSRNMFATPAGISCSIKESANINLVWASLIVEECVRLGLTYFCIAPGSRSSPLAISACNHPHTTCISCFDERSLAFHAVGYGRGSHKPAVVITSSGTAVSNLLPAVVEASHDFVPVLLLTADRPPELIDAGANQAIDQVNHFGKFVRFFFSLPPPTDQIPARMVLTTIDSAVYRSTQIPNGPVHVNCPFREPLEDLQKEWKMNCLNGLDLWMSKAEPFTKYIKMQNLCTCSEYHNEVNGVSKVIQNATRGLLLVGAIHTEDETWAALILAKHLVWPVVTDVLSGLRVRKMLTSFPEVEDHFLYIDHLDHALLSDSVKNWLQPDVVLQIGSKITSKRICQLLEFCSPCSYIMVDKHPYRHDPSHIVTHRIQSTITEFADVLLATHVPRKPTGWSLSLRTLDMMVAQEISFLIHSEFLLTEPYVAHIIGETLQGDAALFVGNSMVIRDMDMFGKGWVQCRTDRMDLMSNWKLYFHGIPVAGNRGASGIDGLLSTAIGFAVGSNKKVLCVIGDVSFLHDTNGLAILNQRMRRKPMTILVINNHGGAIFSLLPIADRAPLGVLNQYFYTSHDISIRKLCAAHRVKHLPVQTKSELQHALWKSQKDESDCVIEVESCIADNANFHRIMNKFARQAAEQALGAILRLSFSERVPNGLSICKIIKVKYSLYRIQLCALPTSCHVTDDRDHFYREGFILAVTLDDGSVGFGEVAPIEIHKEDLLDVEEQLKFLLHEMEGSEISCFLPVIKGGSFSHWIWRCLGVPPSSIFPSVRCGMEMAILNALAARQGTDLSDLIAGYNGFWEDTRPATDAMAVKRSGGVQICALIDCNGTPKEVAHVVSQLVDEGFTAIKIKVARRENPAEDATIIQEIREMVGYQIDIRVDANRKWTYKEAMQFGLSVKNYKLQYVEEPVHLESDIIRFCEESGLPVALDETIDNLEGDGIQLLKEFVHPGVVAVVIKPSVVGGFEKAALIAKWAQLHGKMAVISSAFESSLSLSTYILFAHYLDQQNALICKIKNTEFSAAIAHGFGTHRWLKEDITTKAFKFCVPPHGDTMEASIEDAASFLSDFQINHETIQRVSEGQHVRSYRLTVEEGGFSYSFKLLETGAETDEKVVIFLHGFLGTSEDWLPVMNSISFSTRSISIDLPGHGESQQTDASVELVADMLLNLVSSITTRGVILVGYSMGARIALYMALKYNRKIDGAVIISGSPGLRDETTRIARIAQDEARARCLVKHGLERFLETWYAGNLWKSLRDHPHFKRIMRSRMNHNNIQALAKALSDLSIGRQKSLWEDLKQCKKPLLFIAGERDTKFKAISQQMCAEIRSSSVGDINDQQEICEILIVPDCGHAVHLENPLPVINAVRKFLTKVNKG